jgi:hypothetical protein
MIAGGKEFVFWNLKTLVCCDAPIAEENIDRVGFADTVIADLNKIVAHGMTSQVESPA